MLKTLAKQTAVYGISTIVSKMLNYLLTPYFTRILTRAEYGVVTDMYVIIPFVMVVLTMGLETGYFRFAAKAGGGEVRRGVFSTTWSAVTCSALAFFGLVLLFQQPIASILGYAQRPYFITLVGAIITLDVIAAIPFVRLRERGQARRYMWIKIVSVVVNVVLCFFFYSLVPRVAALSSIWSPEFGAGYCLVANLIASIVALMMVCPRERSSRFTGMDGALLRRMLLYSFPLFVSGVAGTANDFIDRQLIKFMTPSAEAMAMLGIYGAVVKIGVVLALFTQIYRLGAEPFFLAEFKKDDFQRGNAQAFKYFIIVSLTLFLGITLFTDIFSLIIGKDFREGIYILPAVLIGNILSGVVLNLSFWYKQADRTWLAVGVTATGLALNVLLDMWLIPLLGYYGAALGRMFGWMAMVIVSYWLNQKYYRTPYDLRRIGGYVALTALLYGAGILTAHLPHVAEYPINMLLICSFAAYAIWREKIDVFGLVKSITKR